MISPMGTDDLRVLVLAGGLSYEREVSLRSGRRVLDALHAAGVEAVQRDADVSLIPALESDPPDAVFIALHGATGEDGSLRGVLDLCGVPYVGCGAQAARVAWDKPSAKAVLREHGIPTPDWVALPHDRFSDQSPGVLGFARPGRAAPWDQRPTARRGKRASPVRSAVRSTHDRADVCDGDTAVRATHPPGVPGGCPAGRRRGGRGDGRVSAGTPLIESVSEAPSTRLCPVPVVLARSVHSDRPNRGTTD